MKPSLAWVVGLLLPVWIAPILAGASLAGIKAIAAEMKPAAAAPAREGRAVRRVAAGAHSAEPDYGARLDEWRSRAVRSSIASPRFWTMLAQWMVFLMMFWSLLNQSRERERREMIVSEFLAQYHNAWVHATREAQGAIARYNELAEKFNRGPEVVEALNAPALLARAECERESALSPATIFLKSSLRTHSELPAAPARRRASKARAGKLPESPVQSKRE
jgi:hypothetical protein